VLHLYLIESLSTAEIARRLNLREGAARMRLSRGLKRLRARLVERGLEP